MEAHKLCPYRVARLSKLYWSIKSVQQRPESQLMIHGIIYIHCFFLPLLSIFTECPLFLRLSYMLPLACKYIFEVVARLWMEGAGGIVWRQGRISPLAATVQENQPWEPQLLGEIHNKCARKIWVRSPISSFNSGAIPGSACAQGICHQTAAA